MLTNFSERTDALARFRNCSLRDLAGFIGISQAMLFAYRSGKSEPSLKVWRKLERAERDCGLQEEKGNFVPRGTKLKGSDTESSGDPKESEKGLEQIPLLLSRIATALESIVERLDALEARSPATSSGDRGKKSA